jgi:hypothetical protein
MLSDALVEYVLVPHCIRNQIVYFVKTVSVTHHPLPKNVGLAEKSDENVTEKTRPISYFPGVSHWQPPC